MTNPAQAMRLMITYLVVIPLAIVVGYLLTNPMDYSTLGFLGAIVALLISPVFIKWHYQIMVFGIACPAVCFFLPGRPPLAQAVVIMSLFIAIIERALNSEKRFLSVPLMTWPLLYIAGMVYLTAELRGGIGFGSFGGDIGGGRKYLTLFIGLAAYFAYTSRAIPRDRWKFYLALSMLPVVFGLTGDLFPYLGGPLKYINLFFPPTMASVEGMERGSGLTRLTLLSRAVGIIPIYLIARYGLRGIFLEGRHWRGALFFLSFFIQMLGGYRNTLVGFGMTVMLIFFMEGLHRTRLVPVLVVFASLALATLVILSDKLPDSLQRSMSFLPLKWKPEIVMDAEGSTEWRHRIWRATWPKVPGYLLLGKGYALTKEDYDMIGQGTFANIKASHIDDAEQALAISGDYHSGPLSTLMAFGVWGAIGILWLMSTTLIVVYRNYKYGDPELRAFNAYTFANCVVSIISFFLIFGGFEGDVGNYAKIAGFSIAMNGGLARRPARPTSNIRIKPLATSAPQPA